MKLGADCLLRSSRRGIFHGMPAKTIAFCRAFGFSVTRSRSAAPGAARTRFIASPGPAASIVTGGALVLWQIKQKIAQERPRIGFYGRAAKRAGLDDGRRPYRGQKVEDDAAALLLTALDLRNPELQAAFGGPFNVDRAPPPLAQDDACCRNAGTGRPSQR